MKLVSYRRFDELPARYDALLTHQETNSLYLTRHWFENLIHTCFESGDQCRILVVENEADGAPVLMLVCRAPASQNGSVYSQWGLKDGSLASLTNYQSSFFAPMRKDHGDGQIAQACQCLARSLVAEQSLYFIDLNLLDPDSMIYGALKSAFEEAGYRVFPYCYKGNWYENFEFDDFAAYVSSRSKSSRKALQNFQRKYRKLQREERVDVRILTGDDDIEEVMAIYEAIYEASWKEPDAYPDFVAGLIRSCAQQNSLRFGVVSIDGAPAALEFAIVTGTDAIMMRTAYVSDHHKLSVGSIAMLTMIEHLIDVDRVRSIDFGTDDDPYKATWVQNRRERWGLTFVRPDTTAGKKALLKFTVRDADAKLRTLAKKLLRREAPE